jgi:hypothetical protein
LLSITPHVFSVPSLPFNISQNVSIGLESDLLTQQNVYCKLTYEDLSVKYSKLSYSSISDKKQVKCLLERNLNSTNVYFIDVALYMSPTATDSFILSTNNETYLIVPNLLHWRTKRFLNQSELDSTIVDYKIPSRNFDYKIQVKGDYQNPSSFADVNCSYTNGDYPNCALPLVYFEQVNMIPLKLNFTFFISHHYTKLFETISIDYLIYYKSIEFEMVKPFVVSHFERKYSNSTIVSVMKYQLNTKDFTYSLNGNLVLFNHSVIKYNVTIQTIDFPTFIN